MVFLVARESRDSPMGLGVGVLLSLLEISIAYIPDETRICSHIQ